MLASFCKSKKKKNHENIILTFTRYKIVNYGQKEF